MTLTLRAMQPEDRGAVIDIFNDYFEHSFAAFSEQPQAHSTGRGNVNMF
jgi:L-amino acid N-acyltransferase YncA